MKVTSFQLIAGVRLFLSAGIKLIVLGYSERWTLSKGLFMKITELSDLENYVIQDRSFKIEGNLMKPTVSETKCFTSVKFSDYAKLYIR